MSFSFTYPTPLPSTKGWGPGWPNCQTGNIVPHPVFAGGVHKDIKELVDLLVAEAQERGYVFMDPGCWGFGCRGTKSSSGSTSGTPSFHSWGLGLDFNAPKNVFGADRSTSEIANQHYWLVSLMREYGFFWLGPSIGDWMHFSFVGSPADAIAMTEKARKEGLGVALTAEEKATLEAARKFLGELGVQLGTSGPLAAAKVVAAHVKAGGDVEVPHTHTVKVLGKTFTTTEG